MNKNCLVNFNNLCILMEYESHGKVVRINVNTLKTHIHSSNIKSFIKRVEEDMGASVNFLHFDDLKSAIFLYVTEITREMVGFLMVEEVLHEDIVLMRKSLFDCCRS